MTSPTHPSTPGGLLARGLRRQRARLVVFVALLCTWQLCEAMVPVLIGVVIDRAVATGDSRALLLWLGALVALFVVLSTCYRIGARFGVRAEQEEMHALRMEIAGRSLDPRGVRSGLLPGETLSLATSDTEVVGDSFGSLAYGVAAAVSVVVSAVVLLRIDVLLGVVVLGGVPTVLVLQQVITPVIARRSRDQQASIAHATGVATDLVRGFRSLKGIGAEAVASRRYRRHSARAREAGIRTADSWGAMSGLTVGLSGLFLGGVALLAGTLALDGKISIGELISIVGLSQFLAEPMRFLGNVSANVAAALGSARRIVDFLASPALVPSGAAEVGDGPTLELTEVHAGTLRGLSLASRPGELLGIAVAGPVDGASLVRVLSEGLPRERGEVRLGDSALDDTAVEHRHAALVVAPHHVDLFEGTVATNIDPSGGDVADVVEASAVTDILDLHPDGLDRPVTPDGTTYSGGQRQRIAYARALASDAPILVLHDPTTAVDAVTEHRMATGLRRVRHSPGSPLSTWVLTSSPALLAQADRVVLVREGRVVAEGTHADLSTDPDYASVVLR